MNDCVPTRESEVSSVVAQLENALNRVEDKLKILQSKLVSVSTSKPCNPISADKETKLCPLATTIRSFKSRVDNLCGNIVVMIEDLEI